MTNPTGTPPPPTASAEPEGPPPYRAPGVFFTESDAERIAATVVEYGWYSEAARRMVPITPVSWDDPSHELVVVAALHAWEPLDAILAAHGTGSDAAPIDVALAYAHSWLDLDIDVTSPDLGIAGRRSARLAYLATVTDDDRVRDSVARHLESLMRDVDPADPSDAIAEALTGALLLAGSLPPGEAEHAATTVERRLVDHLDAVVTSDGVHRSQAPGRQRRLTDLLATAVESGLLSGNAVDMARVRVEHALAWFVDPEGRLANFGNTTETPISTAYDPAPTGVRFLSDRIVDPVLLHAASRGRHGTPAESTRRIFHDGGFAVIKEPWPGRGDHMPPTAHLVMRTGPPPAAEGVAAGLAFTWHDAGRRLIVEPGPVAPDSEHPAAMHPDEPAAHNRIVVGATDPDGDTVGSEPITRSAPIGGGLQRWGIMEGRYFFDSYESAPDVRHRRSIVFEPGAWLVVADVLDVDDDRPVGPRFHLAEDLDLLATGNRFTVLSDSRPIAWAVSLADQPAIAAARGRVEPEAFGWYSPDGIRMVPNWAFGWEIQGPGIFVTLFTIGERPDLDERRGAWYGWHTDRYQARVAVTEWGIVDIDIRPTREEEG